LLLKQLNDNLAFPYFRKSWLESRFVRFAQKHFYN